MASRTRLYILFGMVLSFPAESLTLRARSIKTDAGLLRDRRPAVAVREQGLLEFLRRAAGHFQADLVQALADLWNAQGFGDRPCVLLDQRLRRARADEKAE